MSKLWLTFYPHSTMPSFIAWTILAMDSLSFEVSASVGGILPQDREIVAVEKGVLGDRLRRHDALLCLSLQ